MENNNDLHEEKREKTRWTIGKREPLKPTVAQEARKEEEFIRLREALNQCTDAVTSKSSKRAAIAVIISVPICMVFKNFLPLLFVSLGTIGYDMYSRHDDCKKQRDAVDLYLLKKYKIKLQNEKEILQMKKNILLGKGMKDEQ
jgi:hypothetical protein